MGDQTRASRNGAPCAVAVAPSGYATSSHALTKLGVGYDRSPESKRALAAARELAGRHGSAISALSVVSLQRIPTGGGTIPGDYWPEVVRKISQDEQERMNALDGVHGKAIYGLPGEELARFGDEVDLLIIGSRGYGPLGRLVHGSTSNHLARYAHCPLLILPRAASVDEPSQLARTRTGSRRQPALGTDRGSGWVGSNVWSASHVATEGRTAHRRKSKEGSDVQARRRGL